LIIDIPFFEKMEYLKNVEIYDISGRVNAASLQLVAIESQLVITRPSYKLERWIVVWVK